MHDRTHARTEARWQTVAAAGGLNVDLPCRVPHAFRSIVVDENVAAPGELSKKAKIAKIAKIARLWQGQKRRSGVSAEDRVLSGSAATAVALR